MGHYTRGDVYRRDGRVPGGYLEASGGASSLLTHPRAVGRLERRGGPVGARHIRRWQGEIGPRCMVYCSDST